MGSPRPAHSEPAVSIRVGAAHTTFSPLRFEATDASSESMEDDTKGDDLSSSQSLRPALSTSHQSYAVKMGVPVQQSMFNLLSATPSPTSTPPMGSPPGKEVNAAYLAHRISTTSKDLRAEVISGVEEIMYVLPLIYRTLDCLDTRSD